MSKPKVAISGCLLGQKVRYNGGHTADSWIIDELSKVVDFVPLCPEMSMGLGTPRDEIHLVKKEETGEIYLRNKKTKEDITRLAKQSYSYLNDTLREANVDGFILMKKSPSCGLGQVRVMGEEHPEKNYFGQGLFAENVVQNFGDVPRICNGRLRNNSLKENFLRSIFAHKEFTSLDGSMKALQGYHMKYKYLLMEYSQEDLRSLGRIVANHQKLDAETIYKQYYYYFFKVITKEVSVKNRYNTLQHIQGYYKKYLSKQEKLNFINLMDDFKKGLVSYDTILEFQLFFAKKFNVDYLLGQAYFSPYPRHLKNA